MHRGSAGQRDDSRPGWREWDSVRFHHTMQNNHNLKLMNYLFLEFPIYFQTAVDWVTETAEGKTADKGGLLHTHD